MREISPAQSAAKDRLPHQGCAAVPDTLSCMKRFDWRMIEKRAVEWRHKLHQIPELGYQEKLTSAFIAKTLKDIGVRYKSGFAGGTGIVATIGSGAGGCVALRTDMDALPIREITNAPWQSRHDGLMHACGHDGHMAIALGVVAALQQIRRDLAGEVKILFQPAEEGLNGAERMCEDGVLENPRVETIFGLHGWPGLPVGTVGFRQGAFLAAVDSLTIEIHGKGTHAASPHHGADPIACGAALVQTLASLLASNIDPLDAVVLTIGTFNAGRAGNVVPESAVLSGTLRTLCATTRKQAMELIRRTCRTVAASHRCRAVCRFTSTTPVTTNHTAETEFFRQTATATLGKKQVVEFSRPFLWSEDFAYYLKRIPGCFFVLGVIPAGRREYPMLHNPLYDFPDSALKTGIQLMATLAVNRLSAGPAADTAK